MDVAWTKQPMPGLLACSTDGTVAFLQFSYDEVGRPLTKLETVSCFICLFLGKKIDVISYYYLF
jgi:hypothetical protein